MKYKAEEIREKYKDLFEYSLDMIYVNDLRGNFLDANDIALETLGYERGEIPDISFIDLLDEENLMKALKITNEIKKTGKQGKKSEYKLRTAHGNHIYVKTYAIPLKRRGRVYAILGIGNNITERKLAEQRLRESEEKYRYLFEDSPFTILLLNSDGRIIDINPAAEGLAGYKRAELLGKKFQDLDIVHPKYLPLLVELFIEFIKGEVLHRIDIQIYKKDKTIIWVNLQASIVEIGDDILVQVILQDITKRKKAELIIKEEIQKLKELDQLRKDLISRVSHELRTPLVSIISSSELLLDFFREKLDDDTLELIYLIQKGGDRLNHLVGNLLDITRIEYNKFKLEKKVKDLPSILKDCSEEMKFLLKRRKIILDLKTPNSLYLKIDGIRIEQVIRNLLLNAIKNTPPNGKITIQLLFTRFGKIERYGEGLEYIDIQGSGLGLFICKEIVFLHRGNIRAESEGRNKGSRFVVQLPLK
ncbi:MAG: PAS domain S-box protein [Promethearchaeota archaeon]|jgi:PAS domain S-box-containing protein